MRLKLFEWTLRLNGFDIAFAKAELKRIQSNNNQYYVESAKIDIVNHHKKFNSFYQNFAGTNSTWDWESLPIMTKTSLQQPLETRLSNDFQKDVYKGKTSGSSGHPFIYAKDKHCHALSWASFFDKYQWYDIDLNHSKQARFYGTPLNPLNYYKEKLKDKLANRYRFPIFNLNDETLAQIAHTFKNVDFEYINGYTSSIVLFAKYLKKQRLILKDICPSLKACIVTSEMLFESDRELLNTQFNVTIINEYGASEVGLIAFENENGDFQVDDELLYIEILDENDNILPDGELDVL